MNSVRIVLPERDDDILSNRLRQLTKSIADKTGDTPSGGLGGTNGYGLEYDSELFQMHPYCWCEADDCRWCSGEAPNFWHKPSGLKVWWYKYIGRSMEVENQTPTEPWKLVQECVDSL